MNDLDRRQDASKVGGWITVGFAIRDRVPEDLAADLSDAAGGSLAPRDSIRKRVESTSGAVISRIGFEPMKGYRCCSKRVLTVRLCDATHCAENLSNHS
jgi:hypothetical protein